MISFLGFRPGKRGKISQAEAKPAEQRAVNSSLLKDVIAGGACGGKASTAQTLKKPDALPLSQSLNVGTHLAAAKVRAIELASRLIPLAGDETAEALKFLVQDLDSRICCIAIAGQVKAGKSSLINVLVEEPGLLPADINPWTTVITKLHFGVPGKPQAGASFTFFNRGEWRRLSHGGRTRELTERIFPGFDWNALHAQVEAMQKRAARKLGARFEDLLGTGHAYTAIAPGLLTRYVAAGAPDEEAQIAGGDGEYSDITKVANIYFDLGAFNFPTILIDTPGVNDPFLVRDEITRQNLESADICLVVLTARQPLSEADLNLLRVLRGLNKNRLIIFINKADEISGGQEVLHEVTRRVSALLRQEFPAANIQIVCGSAIWARSALLSGFIEHGAKPAVISGENKSGSPGNFDWPSLPEIADAVSAETLLHKSGLSSLAVAISEAMQAGPIAEAIAAATALAEAVCRNLIVWLEIETNILSEVLSDPGSARKELSQLLALKAALSAEFDAFSERVAELLALKLSGLQPALARTVEDSLNGLMNGLSPSAAAAHASQIDIKLRLNAESAFLAAFEDASSSLAAEQERFGSGLEAQLAAAGFGGKLSIIAGHASSLSPSLAALSEPAAMNLAGEYAAGMSAIIASFEPIVEKLAGEAAKTLKEKAAARLRQIRALTLAPLEAAAERISAGLCGIEPPLAHGPDARKELERVMETIRDRAESLRLILASHRATAPIQKSTDG